MKAIKKQFQYGKHTVTIETGGIARQASGSVMIDMDGTTVLVTVVGKEDVAPNQDFFPLTVNYQEKTYASGKIPGGYFKREGRPAERETLIARLIDRPIRPLFPDGFRNEVQIIATVMSVNPDVETDVVTMIGASAALALSGIPFNGPISAARVGYKDGEFLLNPSKKELEDSLLNLVVAGTEHAVLMVESEVKILPEDVMLEAVWYGHEQMQCAIEAIKELAKEAGKPAWDWQPPEPNHALEEAIQNEIQEELIAAYQVPEKLVRGTQVTALRDRIIEKFSGETETATENTETVDKPSAREVLHIFEKVEKNIVRNRILDGYPRIDGRDTRTVRPLDIQVGVLPRVHGSALFTRGETQAIVVTTLGVERDAQFIEDVMGEFRDRFLFHYNFPPYCVGETGMVGSPKRREIGHGKLAKRGIQVIIPPIEDFPYTIRIVSEITESNGSSSMASICGSSLSLMDAGVPVKAAVAGIAMGLIKAEQKFAILTDIIGDEDHLGDMDFKVAGTIEGVTALQMDIKIDGITKYIMERALEQAKEARLHILSQMNKVIDKPRENISEYAPTIKTMQIAPEKIRDVIGKGGSTIRSIIEETGADINVNDDGLVSIAAVDGTAGQAAWDRIEEIVADAEVGSIYEGKVVKIMDFGAFINILPGKDGFLHISEVAEGRIDNVSDVLSEGQMVRVKVVEIDRQNRIRLTMRPSAM